MKTMYIEFLGQQPLYIALGIKILTAVVLGGAIGLDREQKMKSAGIKTNILICIGATVYTALSYLTTADYVAQGAVADPNRTAAQIVSGIGFLGAGAIIQGRGNVIGLTTAATIWAVAAIGVTVGFGYPLIATIITFTILFILKLIDPLYKIFESDRYNQDYHIEILSLGRVKGTVKRLLSTRLEDIDELIEEVVDIDKDQRLLHVYISINPRQLNGLQRELKQLIRVEKVKVHQKVDL